MNDDTATTQTAEWSGKLRDGIRNFFVDGFRDGLDRMFEEADDVLFDMANSAANNTDQQNYLDSLRVVRIRREAIQSRFLQKLEKRFASDFDPASDDDDAGEPDTHSIDFDDLQLQDNDAQEKELATRNMVQKAEGLCQMALWELKRRLTWLKNKDLLELRYDAIDPKSICHVFSSSMDELEGIELRTSLIIYKLFDRIVIGNLDEFYRTFNTFLKDSGVETASVEVTKAAAREAAQASGSPPPPEDPGFDPPGADSAQPPDPAASFSPGPGSPGGMAAPSGGNPGYAPGPGAHAGLGPAGAAPPGPPGAVPGAPGASQAGGAPHPGATAPMPGGGNTGAQSPWSPGAGATPGSSGGPAYSAIALDPHTSRGLQSLSANLPTTGAGGGYSDQHLARDLMMASRGHPVAGWAMPRQYSYVQRTDAVGKMFNTIVDDPNVPEHFKGQLEGLRFSAIKSALNDSEFFSNARHPVRTLVNELADMASTAYINTDDSAQRIENFIAQVQGQLEQPAEAFAPESDWDEQEVDPDDLNAFLDEQLGRMKERRQQIIKKARQVAAEELSLRRLGHDLRSEAVENLERSWVPMMALTLLNHGGGSSEWRRGLRLLDLMIQSLDRATGANVPEQRSADTLAHFCELLTNSGVDAEKIEELRSVFAVEFERVREIARTMAEYSGLSAFEERGTDADAADETDAVESTEAASEDYSLEVDEELRQAEAEPEAPAEPEPEPVISDGPIELDEEVLTLIDGLATPGTWFQLYDSETEQSQWMRAIAHYPSKQNIGFCDFNYRNSIIVDDRDFLRDLALGRTMPVDPTPMMRETIRALTEPLLESA